MNNKYIWTILILAALMSLWDLGGATDVQQSEKEEATSTSSIYLGEFLRPWELIPADEYIEINYDNAELTTLIDYMEKKYGLRFILDNIIQPMPVGGKSPVGIKFSFATHRAMNPKEAWDFFLAILNMAMLTVRPGPDERTYYLTTNAPLSPMSVNKAALPTFIGVDPALIPNNDTKIRYVYFVKNANIQTLVNVMNKMLSASHAPPIVVDDVNAIVMTDGAANIRAVLDVVKELDNAVIPETLVIMRLERADASKVKDLYDRLVQEERTLLQRVNPTGKKTQTSFFSENVRVFAWPPANKLFILGPRGGVSRLEEFIRREIDKESDLPYSPLHVYPLKFVGCKEMEQLLNDLKNFQPDSEAAKVGGLVGNTRLLKPTVTVAAEPSTNSLIINADYDDYLQLRELLQKVDVEQPQVALRILVLDVNMQHQKDFGIQMRNMKPGLDGVLGNNVNFQTSGLPFGNSTFSSIVQRTQDASGQVVGGSQRLLGDLVTIAGNNVPGSTLVTLGQDIYGVWGLFKVLDTVLNTTVVAKPFLVVSNKYNAQISIGQIFRVTTSNIIGGADTSSQTLGDLQAALTVNVTPQISPDGLVTLNVMVDKATFLDQSGDNRNEKKISTSVIVGENQVLALGGITQDIVTETMSKVPVLGDIPLLGWFFKNKVKTTNKVSLLILISATIIRPHDSRAMDAFTRGEFSRAENLLCKMTADDQPKDPVNRLFFQTDRDPIRKKLDEFRQWDIAPIKSMEHTVNEPINVESQDTKETGSQDKVLRRTKKKSLSDFVKNREEKT